MPLPFPARGCIGLGMSHLLHYVQAVLVLWINAEAAKSALLRAQDVVVHVAEPSQTRQWIGVERLPFILEVLLNCRSPDRSLCKRNMPHPHDPRVRQELLGDHFAEVSKMVACR